MTLGERLIELADYGFQIKFEKQNALIDSESIVVMTMSRGCHHRYFAFDPFELNCNLNPSEYDGFILEEINYSVRKIIDAENEELTARGEKEKQ